MRVESSLTNQILGGRGEALRAGEIVEESFEIPFVVVDRVHWHEAVRFLLSTSLDAGAIPHLPGPSSHRGRVNLLTDGLACAVTGKPSMRPDAGSVSFMLFLGKR